MKIENRRDKLHGTRLLESEGEVVEPPITMLDANHRGWFIRPRLRQSSFHWIIRVGVLLHRKTSHNIKINLNEIFSLFDSMFMTVNGQIELRSRIVLYQLPRNSVLLFLYLLSFISFNLYSMLL